MNRLDALFDDLAQRRRTALIPFIAAGDPDRATTLACMHALVSNGADILEIGVPFSDPMADGPVIQQAYERAIAGGMRLEDVLSLIEEFRKTDQRTAVVLMGYLNPIERMGTTAFVDAAARSGVDSVLLVDLPPEEGEPLRQALLAHDIYQTFLVAPTSTRERLELIASKARGFLYYVAIKGVTGAALLEDEQIRQHLAEVRQHADLPIAIGFGIKNAQDAVRMGELGDAIVIGSALIQCMTETHGVGGDVAEASGRFLAPIRQVLDN